RPAPGDPARRVPVHRRGRTDRPPGRLLGRLRLRAPGPTVTAVAREVRPYGSWSTPITAARVGEAAVRLGGLRADGADLWWLELRPQEAGRTVLVRRRSDGITEDVLPAPWNVRTAVHEYGGGAMWVRDGVAWFTDWADQRLYRLE